MDWKSIPFRILIVWQKGISLHNFMGIDFLMRIEFGSTMGKYLVRLFDEKILPVISSHLNSLKLTLEKLPWIGFLITRNNNGPETVSRGAVEK